MSRTGVITLAMLCLLNSVHAQDQLPKADKPEAVQTTEPDNGTTGDSLVVPGVGMIMETTPANPQAVAMNQGDIVDVVQQDGERFLVIDQLGNRRWVSGETIRSLPAALEMLLARIKVAPKDYACLFQLASAYYEIDRYDTALEYSNLLLKHHPQAIDVYVSRSQLLTGMQRYEQAIETATQGLKIEQAKVLYVNRGFAYDRMGKLDKSLADYERALDIDPNDVMALNNIASIRTEQGKYDLAIRDFTSAIKIREVDFLYRGRGIAREQKQQLDLAVQDMANAIRLNPANENNFLTRGRTFTKMGRLDLAEADFIRALRLAPDDTEGLNDLGAVYAKLNRTDEAIKMYRRAIRFRPDYPLAWSNLSAGLRDKGLNEEALENANKAIELDNQLAVAHYNRAMALENLGQTDEAISAYGKAVQSAPDNLSYRNDRGVLLLDHDRLDEAFADFQFCIEAEPDESLYWANRGRVWAQRTEVEKALSDFGKAIELDPNSDFPLLKRGALFLELNRYDDAVVDLTKATEIDPDWVPGWFELGRACTGAGLLEEAVNVYGEAIKRDPRHFPSVCNRSLVNYRLEKYKESKRDALRAVELAPLDLDATYNLARAHYELGEYGHGAQQFSILLGSGDRTHDLLVYRGDCFLNSDQFERAVHDYSEALMRDPESLGARHARGFALRKLERLDEALADFDHVLNADPKQTRTRLQRAHLHRTGANWEKAISDYEEVARAVPSDSQVQVILASLYCSVPTKSLLDSDKAVTLAKRSVESTNGNSTFCLAVLSVAQANAGDFDAALATAKRSFELAEKQGRAPVTWLSAAVKNYQQQKPWILDLQNL